MSGYSITTGRECVAVSGQPASMSSGPHSVDVQQSETILARSCEARPGVLFTLSTAVLTAPFEIVEALYLYPLFYPLVKIFRHYVRAREMMRFSRFT